jgi:CheY-like chemotaxis protein
VTTEAELRAEMGSGLYPYVFIASNLYESVRELCGKCGKETQIVLLAGFGEAVADKNLRILAMPVYATSVASILNGVTDSFTYNESGEAVAGFSAPEASVLIVDDIGTNLMVAQGLLMPYGMRVTLCGGGAEAVEAVKDKRFDIILMDHMMPGVNGIEAVARIRALGSPYYETVPIIALTANAVSGMKEMFLGSGFNDFLSKPIDVLKLNTIMERWIPKEKQQPIESSVSKRQHCPALNPRLLAAFRRDAEKAAVTMREAAASGDIKAFTTSAHGMKSALAVIGETEKSNMAFMLEQAGLRGDREAICANVERFLESLAELVRCMTQAEDPENA